MLKNDRFYERARALVSQLTDYEKLGLLTTHHEAVERLGLKEFYIGTEVARGYVGRQPEIISTVFPQPVGLASTFDRGLMYELGVIAGDEARAYYNDNQKIGITLWGPTVDMVRDPRWGRTEEAYGEDVCLTGELSAAYTKGMAGENGEGYYKTVPTLKHFCANNNEEDRGSCSAFLTPRLKHEYYYAAFENAIRHGGAKSIMAAYNEINGLPAIMNSDIRDILKDEWGLWFTVSDGGDFSQNVAAHEFCETHSEAYKLCLEAGCDTMTDEDSLVKAAAKAALAEGLITWEQIDESITNTLYARLRLGMLDKTEFDGIGKSAIDTEQSRQTNLRAACEGVTLLKNDGLLPLKDTAAPIAVVGALADDCLMDWYTGYSSYERTVLDGVREEFSGEVLYDSLWDIVAVKAPNGRYLCAYDDGSIRADADKPEGGALFELQNWGENWQNLFSCKYKKYARLCDGELKLHNRRIYDWFTRETLNLFDYEGDTLIEEFLHHGRLCVNDDGVPFVKAQRGVSGDMRFNIELISSGKERGAEIAKKADTVIYCVGNYPVQTAKECYDRKTLKLNIQPGMTQTLAAANKNTVLAVISSYPYAINDESRAAAAVIYTSHAGAELGRAVAYTLSGKNNPAGRTPLTWYRSENELPDIMDYDIESGGATYMYFKGKPLYPFGHGLSYSHFEYSDMVLTPGADGVKVQLSVKNTSPIAGDEVVQVYFAVNSSAVTRPGKKLCAFERVHFAPHEQKTLTMTVPYDILRIFDVRAQKMIVESGVYTFMAGASSQDIRLTGECEVRGEALSPRGDEFLASMFDKHSGIELRYSKKHRCEYVFAKSWVNELTFGGVQLEGAKALVITAMTLVGDRPLKIKAGGKEYELTIAAGGGADHFYEYVLPLDTPTGDTIEISMAEFTALMGVKIIR
ncbi:MAG: glycoside hydrolase family 3 C-terminal domain-containing protein [Ruminococcus sp.]|nr:glycoside hydrolase family 3 C-terminal domain-containing protein [Ruminococcus sp.]